MALELADDEFTWEYTESTGTEVVETSPGIFQMQNTADFVPGTWTQTNAATGEVTTGYDAYAGVVESGLLGSGKLIGGGAGSKYDKLSLRQIADQFGEFYDSVGFADEAKFISSGDPDQQARHMVREVPFNDGTGRWTIYYSDGSFKVVTRGNGQSPDEENEFAPDGTPLSAEHSEFKGAFYQAMNEIGLESSLIESLWKWAEKRFVADSSFGAAQASVELYEQPAFRKRFSGIAELRDEDEPRRDIPSPAEYLRFEKDVIKSMTLVGMDTETANVDELIKNLVINSVGLTEVDQRLAAAKRMVYDVPDDVRNTFLDWYGPEAAEANLMKTFLDPEDKWGGSWPSMLEKTRTAEIGGWAKMYAGIDMTQTKEAASKISKLGISNAETWSKFATLREQENLFAENLDEVVDLDTETHGVSEIFNIDVANDEGLSRFEIQDILQKRAERRATRFSGGGGALMSGTTTGYGATNA